MPALNGFDGDYTGLTDQEVARLQQRYGKNEIIPEKKENFFGKVLGVLKEPMFILLFAAAFIYFLIGEPRDGTIMLFFVAGIAGIDIFQEWKTDKTLQELKELSDPRVMVIRESLLREIDSRELVPGDLMLLKEGEKIPADGELIELHDFGVDESSLTGESGVVWKVTAGEDKEKKIPWRRDYAYAGTAVIQGRAVVRVTSTGAETEYGQIGRDVAEAPERPTPLERQTRRLIRASALAGLVMFILVFLVTYQHSGRIIDGILSGITLAMALIPEEFPVILTVFLSMGAYRLAKKNSLIRRLPSVETLGAVSVLCVDKTGTLTRNRMEVQKTCLHHAADERELALWAGRGCETEPYDPMEKAMLVYSDRLGLERARVFTGTLIHEYPFSSETKMMGHVWRAENGEISLAAKGSPESILPLCRLTGAGRAQVESKQAALASEGLRVIAVAWRRNMDEIPEELAGNDLELAGLIGLADPPRSAVPGAIESATRAGIRVVMITGDNGLTARSIARRIGIPNHEQVVTGKELDVMSDAALRERVKTAQIFARVIPRHKMRIVRALKGNGEIVAMTGDGVNDAPALKYADIGIAMGRRGTGVAREAADMILLDDNFTTIVDTVRDGRRIFANIRKAIGYVFVIHIPIALAALLAPLLHRPLMLLPIHIVLLELIIDPTCSIVFERQPAERDIMKRIPRPAGQPLVTAGLLAKSALQGLAIFAASFGSYLYLLDAGASADKARSFALAVLVFANILLVYVNQSESSFALAGVKAFRGDRVLGIVNSGVILGLVAILYLPAANMIVSTVPLSGGEFSGALGIAAAATLWWEAVKGIRALRARAA